MSTPHSGYTITAALPYANGPLHIGHLAGAYLPADIYARYLRSRREDILFVCGSDESGVAITLQARQENITPQALIDKYHAQNKKSFAALGIQFDIFSRTSAPIHHKTAQDFFTTLHERHLFTTKETAEYYDEKEKIFLPDRYLQGTCPHCQYDKAYADQCESCGTSLSPQDLLAPHSRLSGQTLVKKKTIHWYLPLDRYSTWLQSWLRQVRHTWRPNVYQQCMSWLKQGLRPRAMTRDLHWGVKVPLAKAQGKVLYVWFEAPIGYISATKEWAANHGRSWQDFWQDPKRHLIHFIGKDNIVFHALIFPIILHAHGGYILPSQVVANEFMNLESQKISTSRQHAIWLHDYLQKYPDKQDILRYVLCANAPETKDSNFTWQDFKERNNNELVATLGNFIHRTLILLHKYCKGKIPSLSLVNDHDEDTINHLLLYQQRIERYLENMKFRKALETLMDTARLGNKYLADTAPWKAHPKRQATILHISSQIMAHIQIFATPFLPFTAEKLRQMLQMPNHSWHHAKIFQILPRGHQIGTPQLLFDKIET